MKRRASASAQRSLNRPFADTGELIAAALGLLAQRVPADRLACFVRHPRELLLEMRMCLHHGARQELEEEIHLAAASPIGQLLEGRRPALAYMKPHPILYVPLRMPAAWAGGEKDAVARGVLRLERLGGSRRRPFTKSEHAAAVEVAEELALALGRSELAHRAQAQLKRMEALTELAAIFASSLRVEDGLKLILQGVQQHFGLDRVRLYLVDRAAQSLRGELSVDMRGQVKNLRGDEHPLKPGVHRFVDLVLGEAPEGGHDRFRETVLHIPLVVQANPIGLLVADNLTSQEPIAGEDVGLLKSFAGQIALAVDNARLFDEVQALSLYDSLTGLPVRRFFFQRFQEEIYRSQRFGQPMALALIDIDYYKEVNDTYGHQVGDEVLKEIGRVILANLRKIDFPCRYGGDEVLILLPQSREEDARTIMTRLAQQIREIRIPAAFSRAREVAVTASIGIATYPEDGRTAEDLLQRADEALYWVKSHGKDKVAAFAETKKTEAVDRETGA